jgi:hypothetical protein
LTAVKNPEISNIRKKRVPHREYSHNVYLICVRTIGGLADGYLYSFHTKRVGTDFLTSEENIMTSITNKQTLPTPSAPFSLMGFIETLFAVKLREQLDADTKGDKSDAGYTWGM